MFFSCFLLHMICGLYVTSLCISSLFRFRCMYVFTYNSLFTSLLNLKLGNRSFRSFNCLQFVVAKFRIEEGGINLSGFWHQLHGTIYRLNLNLSHCTTEQLSNCGASIETRLCVCRCFLSLFFLFIRCCNSVLLPFLVRSPLIKRSVASVELTWLNKG